MSPHRINIEEAWDDFTRMKALVDESEAADFLAVMYAWRDEEVSDALRRHAPPRPATPSEDRRRVNVSPRCAVPYPHGPHTVDDGRVQVECPGIYRDAD